MYLSDQTTENLIVRHNVEPTWLGDKDKKNSGPAEDSCDLDVPELEPCQSPRSLHEVTNSFKDSLVDEVNEDFRLFGAVDDSVPSGGTNEGLLKLFKLRFKAREGQPWTDDKNTQLKKDAFYAELLVVKPYFQ
jgi:hypothetical protein